ncbi:unnamed protein product [Boreogadus saida]
MVDENTFTEKLGFEGPVDGTMDKGGANIVFTLNQPGKKFFERDGYQQLRVTSWATRSCAYVSRAVRMYPAVPEAGPALSPVVLSPAPRSRAHMLHTGHMLAVS